MGDVPYSNYFVVNNYMEIIKDGETKCKMNVDMSIVFNKSTYMKGTILSRTITDMKDDYNVHYNLYSFGSVKWNQLWKRCVKLKKINSETKVWEAQDLLRLLLKLSLNQMMYPLLNLYFRTFIITNLELLKKVVRSKLRLGN